MICRVDQVLRQADQSSATWCAMLLPVFALARFNFTQVPSQIPARLSREFIA
jgi:hypothetical protein